MHVYVDESGDLGFTKKSTKFFVVAYAECVSPQPSQVILRRALKHLHQKKRYASSRNELKFSRMDDYCRRYVLEKIADCEVGLGVVVLEKALVNSNLRKDPPVLYNWCVVHNIMLSLLQYIAAGNKVKMVFDRSLPAWRIKEFNGYVQNKASYLLYEQGSAFSQNSISSVHVASEVEPCLQMADAVAGAYFQKYEHKNDDYVSLIENKIAAFKYLWKK